MSWKQLKLQLLKDNDPSKRLAWVRGKLGFTQYKVSSDLEVPRYHEMESGERTRHYETVLLIAMYYNHYWQKKYNSKTYPEYKKKKVEKITPYWIFYGQELTGFSLS